MPSRSKPQSKIIATAVKTLQQEGIIAYPTEAVYGLGCNPFNEATVQRILDLKHRNVGKGLILIASSWEQVKDLTLPVSTQQLELALASWPGPTTWIFPASAKASKWITGQYSTVAIRVSAHPVVKNICDEYKGPIVSTSANIEGMPPAKTSVEVAQQFPSGIDYIVPGSVGELQNPTQIRDILTEKTLRNS